ncbi:hypothetical protein Pcinc_039368, partial [Petrolisthes cinctipes]
MVVFTQRLRHVRHFPPPRCLFTPLTLQQQQQQQAPHQVSSSAAPTPPTPTSPLARLISASRTTSHSS